jgi:hypothetical protein
LSQSQKVFVNIHILSPGSDWRQRASFVIRDILPSPEAANPLRFRLSTYTARAASSVYQVKMGLSNDSRGWIMASVSGVGK